MFLPIFTTVNFRALSKLLWCSIVCYFFFSRAPTLVNYYYIFLNSTQHSIDLDPDSNRFIESAVGRFVRIYPFVEFASNRSHWAEPNKDKNGKDEWNLLFTADYSPEPRKVDLASDIQDGEADDDTILDGKDDE